MRYFEIVDSRHRRSRSAAGLLVYDEAEPEKTRRFTIYIAPDASVDEVPMLFIPFIEKEQRVIPPEWALVCVHERIPPVNRQNISEILIANGHEEYDALILLLAGEGRCCQDEFMVREVALDELVYNDRTSTYVYSIVSLEESSDSLLRKSFGKALADARCEAGLTQAALSQKSGVSQAKICVMEKGEGNPTLTTLALLADGLGMQIRVEFV